MHMNDSHDTHACSSVDASCHKRTWNIGSFDGIQGSFDGIQGSFDGIQGSFDGIQGSFERMYSVTNVLQLPLMVCGNVR